MKEILHQYDFVIAGGGLTGLAAAVTAARNGLKTALVTDRPVLGGNASKEIQVPPSGCNCCGRSYIYGRETGFTEELLLDNLKLNSVGNIEMWNISLLNCVKKQKDLDVFYNTSIDKVCMSPDGRRIVCIKGYTYGSETHHTFEAGYFADCTGDGTVGALAGIPFRMGCEKKSEFNESLATEEGENRVMGCSIRFKAVDTGHVRVFQLPSWCKYHFNKEDLGPYRPIEDFIYYKHAGFWWMEWGGFFDTLHETNMIQDELQQIIFGLWDFMKNRSSLKAELSTFDLDWVSAIPGKRESRRLEGEHILTQNDIDQQRYFDDAIAYGGWGYDDHPPAGIFDERFPGFHIYHKGPYNIPLRCLYSNKVQNLFFAGRNISATHIALTSTRIIITCAQLGEAIGTAASVGIKSGMVPDQLYKSGRVSEVQKGLQKADHTIMKLPYKDEENLASLADVYASSELASPVQEKSNGTWNMDGDYMWMFPVITGHIDAIDILLDVEKDTVLEYKLFAGPDNESSYPENKLAEGSISLKVGLLQWVTLPFDLSVQKGWHFVETICNTDVKIYYGKYSPVGLKSMFKTIEDPIRINTFSKWGFHNNIEDLPSGCFRIRPAQPVYGPDNLINEWNRPTGLPNLWISSVTDFVIPEWVELTWNIPVEARELHLLFDSSLDCQISAFRTEYHLCGSLETVPSIIRDYRILVRKMMQNDWTEIAAVQGNYQRRCVHKFEPVMISALKIEIGGTNGINRAQIYSLRVY